MRKRAFFALGEFWSGSAFSDDYIDYVYDITIAYPQNVVDSERRLLVEGRFPREVHFDIRKYSVDEVTRGENNKNYAVDASEWLLTLWKDKEARLKRFYEDDHQLVPSGEGLIWPVCLLSRLVLILHRFV